MKNFEKIFALLAIGCFFVFSGCDGGGSSGSSNETRNMEKTVAQLQKKIKSLADENRSLTKQRDEAQSIARSRYVTLSIIAYTALGIAILLIIGFIFMLKKTPRGTISNDITRCPRCGWEHGPDETVCKNCKTHF